MDNAAAIPPSAIDVMATDMFSRPVRVATATAKSVSSATAGSKFSHIPFVLARQNGISQTANQTKEVNHEVHCTNRTGCFKGFVRRCRCNVR